MINRSEVRLLKFKDEYLESVGGQVTTWTTDPERAIHFLSEELIPVTTVILTYPILEPLFQSAMPIRPTSSEINQRKRVAEFFESFLLPQEIPALNGWNE